MKQKSNGLLLVLLLVGLAISSYVSNQLYNWKAGIVPYEGKAPTQFYAGMDKFLSNISWMTLVQWQAEDLSRMTPARATALYQKLDSLTNLDPLFSDAYVDGAMSLAVDHPDLSMKLLDKAIVMGLGDHWRVPFYAGHINMMNGNNPAAAAQYFEMATKDQEAPDYVQSSLLRAKCMGANDAPVASMHYWYEYYQSLGEGNKERRMMAASQLRGFAEDAGTDVESRLQAASDTTTRESVLKDRQWVADVLKEVNAAYPPGAGNPAEPTTAPTTAPNV